MSRLRIFAFFLVSILSISAVASATTMRELSVADLVEQSDLIVRGRVASTSDVMTVVDGRLVPRLVARVEVLETLAGDAPSDVISVVEDGGRDRSLVIVREGLAEFRRGQNVLVFLRRTTGGYRSVGHAQGAFEIRKDRRTHEERARRSGDPGVLLFGGGERGLALDANPRLDALRSAVVTHVRGRR